MKVEHKSIPRFHKVQQQKKSSLLPAVNALLAGLVAHEVLPSIIGADTAGSGDEWSTLFAGMAGYILSSLKESQELCGKDKMRIRLDVSHEIGKGALGGGGFALAITSQTSAALLSLVDGGIIFVGTVLGALYAEIRLTKIREKVCPHCGEEGNCSQRICRNCLKIFGSSEKFVGCFWDG